ncbi:MAG: NADH:ubiquinone reductase (Na(+)-transporting) subunit B [Bacteroidales bacterium]|nr:NADH:ubiquinone reductase (Na(+)-transporting) subunit B [Bacteroidales bacterium]
MSRLRNFIDKIKPNFEKGGRFAKLHSTFDAFETFAYTPKTVTASGSHIRDAVDLKRTMIVVVMALVPALLFGMWNVGFQHFRTLDPSLSPAQNLWGNFWYGFLKVLPIIIVSYVTGLAIEFTFAQIRGHEVNEGFLATGLLIPLVLPVTIPLWQVAVATAFAVIIGKEAFGGTGMNFVNPALLARAFLFFAYPSSMSGNSVWVSEPADALTGATPLSSVTTGQCSASLADMFWGFVPGSIGETCVPAILLGALLLLVTGVASWRIMAAVLAGAIGTSLMFNAIGGSPMAELPFYYHLVMGGFAFGCVFMATDPVTAAQTNIGKWIYGFLIGFLVILIRVKNSAYPEGMMLAILLMNVFAPLIDYIVVWFNIRKRIRRAAIK